MPVPPNRIATLNAATPRAQGRYVLYWMIANRRTRSNFALDRALEWCRELDRPLLVLEPLTCSYRWACQRFHRFVLDGMIDQASAFQRAGVTYFPYVEPSEAAGRGLVDGLAEQACVVVTDEFPCFFLPKLVQTQATRSPVLVEAVDSNGLLPLRAANGRIFTVAHSFRRFLQKELPRHISTSPRRSPLQSGMHSTKASIPRSVSSRWKPTPARFLQGEDLSSLPIDTGVPPAPWRGGQETGRQRAREFVNARLARYVDDRNEAAQEGTSGLSPYLHFGHVSAHEVLDLVAAHEDWSASSWHPEPTGSRNGTWGMSAEAEGFLDQLVTWRELGYNRTFLDASYDRFDSLPDWALRTLAAHRGDPRPTLYSARQLEKAETGDELWNAAQRELVTTGRLHNYLRMLWGKKILEWSPTPEIALDTMIEFNNKYALDGRNPNSYSGIFWVLGRYDRAWGPERPIFGKVRYMSSANTRRKLDVGAYIAKHTPQGDLFGREST